MLKIPLNRKIQSMKMKNTKSNQCYPKYREIFTSMSKGHGWLCCPSVYLGDTAGKCRAEDGLIGGESSSLKVGIINNQPSGKD